MQDASSGPDLAIAQKCCYAGSFNFVALSRVVRGQMICPSDRKCPTQVTWPAVKVTVTFTGDNLSDGASPQQSPEVNRGACELRCGCRSDTQQPCRSTCPHRCGLLVTCSGGGGVCRHQVRRRPGIHRPVLRIIPLNALLPGPVRCTVNDSAGLPFRTLR